MSHALPIELGQSPWIHRGFITSDEPSICLEGVVYDVNSLLLAALRDFWMPKHRCLIIDLGGDLRAPLRALMEQIGVPRLSLQLMSVNSTEYAWEVPTGGLLFLVDSPSHPVISGTGGWWDCIVIDHVDELGSKELGHVVRAMRENGRLRTARNTTRTEALLGRKVRVSGMADTSIGSALNRPSFPN